MTRSLLAAVLVVAACAAEPPEPDSEVVYRLAPPTWFEDGWSYYDVAPDGRQVVFGARFGVRLFDLQGREEQTRLASGLDQVRGAAFTDMGSLVRNGTRSGKTGWYAGPGGEELLPLPPDVVPTWKGSRVAYFRRGAAGLFAGSLDDPAYHATDGAVTGIAWSAHGDLVFAMVFHPDGKSSLVALDPTTGLVEKVRDDLDATSRFNSIGVAPDGLRVFIALASPNLPDDEARHQPSADRDMDIYQLHLETKTLELVVQEPGDDFYPTVVGGHLYWTHNEIRDDVVVLPRAGGETTVVIQDGQIPYWSTDGTSIGFTHGGWRIADWALNLDVAVVTIDADGQAVAEPVPLVTGYHEDFTPAWSPDGRWMAYHSHRATGPVPAYSAEGSTDDLYLMRAGTTAAEEIRLTDFGWEVGMADWAPDSRRLIFDSWQRDAPGVAQPWVATIDTETGHLVNAERLALPPGFRGTLLAAWSPKGEEIALVERVEGQHQALWITSLDGARAEKLLEFRSSTYGGVDWTPDGEHLIFGALADDRMQLFSLHRSGKDLEQLTEDPASLIQPQVSPDGRWIAATRLHRAKELRRQPL